MSRRVRRGDGCRAAPSEREIGVQEKQEKGDGKGEREERITSEDGALKMVWGTVTIVRPIDTEVLSSKEVTFEVLIEGVDVPQGRTLALPPLHPSSLSPSLPPSLPLPTSEN